MEFFIGLLIVIILFSVIIEHSIIVVYGKPVSDKDALKYIEAIGEINSLNNSILVPSTGYKYFIGHINGIISKYYISDVGIIPRWSKSHKLIKEKYRVLSIERNIGND